MVAENESGVAPPDAFRISDSPCCANCKHFLMNPPKGQPKGRPPIGVCRAHAPTPIPTRYQLIASQGPDGAPRTFQILDSVDGFFPPTSVVLCCGEHAPRPPFELALPGGDAEPLRMVGAGPSEAAG